jgi:uncharacterized membrane protein YphA (DoxX/SURF4 family)
MFRSYLSEKITASTITALRRPKVPVFHNYGFETPVLYLAIFLTIFASGPGKLSIAQALGWNDDKSLFGKIKQ